MKHIISLCLLLLTVPAVVRAQTATPPTRAIVGGTVVNPDGGSIPDATVVIAGDRITAVGPAATTQVPAGAEVTHAEGRWLMSGLFNMHVHLGLVLPGAQGAELANETDAALALRMATNA